MTVALAGRTQAGVRQIVILVASLAAGACGGGGGSGSTAPAPPIVGTQLGFTVQPGGASGGQVLAPAVQVAIRDASGNTVATATNAVTIALGSNQAGGTLSGTTTVAAVNGIATFSTLSVDKAGKGYTLVAAAADLSGATSATFDITVGAPARLAFTVQPSNAVAGQAVAPAVQVSVRDAGGNLVAAATSSVTLATGTHPAGGVLSGTTTVVAVNGLATFSSLVLNKAGTGYTLLATAATLSPATSVPFAVTPGASAQLAFTGQPTTVVAGRVMTPPVQVTVLDAEGNTVTGFPGAVTVALGTNPGGGTLSGTVTAAPTGGVATFSDLSVTSQGNGYTLVASAGSLAATSAAFIVGTTGIDYHGGTLIHSPKVAALYWSDSVVYAGGPAPGTFGAASGDQSVVGFFLRNLGGSPYFNINATYFDAANAFVQNVVTYTQYWADSVGPATAAPTDADIQAEIQRGFATGALAYDSSTLYAVFTGSGINLGGGFGTAYCGYHGFFFDAQGRNVKYAALPHDHDFKVTSTTGGCSFSQVLGSPNGDAAADAEVNVLAHELAETVTDENLDAWFVTSGPNGGEEMADLCNFDFGTVFTTPNGARANEVIGGRSFLVQMLWVNMETAQGTPVGCQQSWAAPAVVASARRVRAARAAMVRPTAVAGGRHVMRMYGGGRR